MIGSEARGVWSEIEARLRPYIARRVASTADVDDIVQETFVRMQRGIAGLRDEERFGGWVYRIAKHAIIDATRASAKQPIPSSSIANQQFEPCAYESGDEAADLQAELGECVALFVARLPARYRAAITLTDLEGLTQRDAADMLGISLSGMKSRVQRGRERIRDMFDECCRVSVDCRGRVVECEPRDREQSPEDCRSTAASWAARRR
jgi:RNA polymerase sigma-70 factor, ECF subfamily